MGKIIFSLILLTTASTAFADLICRWDPNAAPASVLIYSPKHNTIRTLTGWPQKWHRYTGVKKVRGVPPFSKAWLTYTVFGDVPAVTVLYTPGDAINNSFEGYWGKLPGGPAPAYVTGWPIRGTCWVTREH